MDNRNKRLWVMTGLGITVWLIISITAGYVLGQIIMSL